MMPTLMTVESVAERYLCDRHKAASIINSIPASFRVGKRLFVAEKDLIQWEDARKRYATNVRGIPRRR